LEAGLSPEQAVMAVAIASGESGHRDAAEGDTTITDGTWGPSLGRWQVRCLWSEIGTGGTRDCSLLNDPKKNARSMYEISSGGTNWRPWSVYLHSLHEPYLADARRAVDDVTGNPSVYVQTASGGREPAPAAPPVERTPGRLLDNLWRLTMDRWVSIGRSSSPEVREAWQEADAELFGAPQ
jgi:hypothetical protein